ncbi:MAG: cation:proton antiporter [Balneolales bacterium]
MDFLSIAVDITFVALGISIVLAFYRVVVGPSLPDRVVALDLIAYLVIGFIATFCISVGQSVYLDAAIVLALIAFLGTIAFARYVAHPKEEAKL